MSQEPSAAAQGSPQPPANRRPLLFGLLALLVFLLALAGVNLLGRPPAAPPPSPAPVPATPPGATATEAAAAAPSGTAAGATGLPGALPSAPAAVGAGGTPGLPGPLPSAPAVVGAGGTPGLPGPLPSASAARGLGGTSTVAPAGTLEPAPTGIAVVDAVGSAYACARTQGCSQNAAPGVVVFPGGEARTGAAGRLRLQTPGGLLILDVNTTLRPARLDATQAALTLAQGQVLARAAAGREETLTIGAAPATVTGAGSNFAVRRLSDGSVYVAVPADSAHAAHVHTGSGDADLAPGTQMTVAAGGALGAPTPLDAALAAALAALGGAPGTPALGGSAATPAPAAITTELPVPSAPPLPVGVVTATIVLTPPPEQTLVPVTVLPLGTPAVPAPPAAGTATAPAGTPGPATSPATPPAGSPAALLAAGLGAMKGISSYTFGATNGTDPATTEFSAGRVIGDTACWTATVNRQQSDYQVRGGVVFRRTPGSAWQQQPDQHGLPASLTSWRLIGQVDPATIADLGDASLDAMTVHHLRARLLPGAGRGGADWIDAFLGDPDHLVHSLVLYSGDPAAGQAVFKMGLSSFAAPLSCPPLNQP